MTRRDWDDAHLINAAIDTQDNDPVSGYWCITGGLCHTESW